MQREGIMPFSPHKIKSIFILTTLLLTGFTHYSFSQERTIYQGRFPIPFISVDQFILTPRTRASLGPPASCDTGTIYVDNITSELTVCGLPNVVSNPIHPTLLFILLTSTSQRFQLVMTLFLFLPAHLMFWDQ